MVAPERLEALFKTYHDPLVRFLTRQLGDRDAAEEIAQETFVRALQQDVILNERSWIFAVAMNLVRDKGRKGVRRQKRLAFMKETQGDDAIVEQPVTSMERNEDRA